MISSFGDSSLPVFQAGQTSWQRPHSVHENVSIICFQVRSGTVPAPKRRSSSSPSKSSGSSRPPGPRAAEVDVERRGRDVQVLGVREVGEEAEDDQHVRPHEDALEHLGDVAVAEQARQRVRHRRPARGPLVEAERDPRRVPQQQRRDDPGDHGQDQVGLAEVAALEALRALHLADPHGGHHAEQHEHREHVDHQREPALVAEPRQRGVARRPPRSSRSRSSGRGRRSPRRSPRASGPGPSRWNSLRWPSTISASLRTRRGTSSKRVDRLAEPHEVDQQLRAAREQAAADGERGRERERSGGDVYCERAFLSSAVIAGTISVRSPITA